MSYPINSIANVYHAKNGTPLMQCQFAAQTDTSITLMVSVQEFLRLTNLHEQVLVVLTSPTLGLLPYICTAQAESALTTDTDAEQHIQLQFHIDEKRDSIQRRQDFKVKTSLEVEVSLLSPEKGPCSGTIEDLSAGGMLFATEMPLQIGQDFVVAFTETKEPLYLHVKIIRQQSNGRIKRYGCQFQQLLPMHEEMLRQYVFKLEAVRCREQRK